MNVGEFLLKNLPNVSDHINRLIAGKKVSIARCNTVCIHNKNCEQDSLAM